MGDSVEQPIELIKKRQKKCPQCLILYIGRDEEQNFAFPDSKICISCEKSGKKMEEAAKANNKRHGSMKRKNIQMPPIDAVPVKKISVEEDRLEIVEEEEAEEEDGGASDFKAAAHKIIEDEYQKLNKGKNDDEEDAEMEEVSPFKSKVEPVKQPIKRKRAKRGKPSPPPPPAPAAAAAMVVTSSSPAPTAATVQQLADASMCMDNGISQQHLLVQKGQNLIHSYFDLKRIVPEKCDLLMTVKL